MHRFKNALSLICFGASVLALSAATISAAEVMDDGNFFSANTIREASAKIQELDHRYGYRIKVETIAALPAGEAEEVGKMGAADRAKFFGHYLAKRAGAERLDLLIFASRDPKYLQVLPHKKLESAGFTIAMRDKMAAALIAGFHTQKYDEALSAALTQLEQDFQTVHRAAAAPGQEHRAQMPVQAERPFERPAARPPAEGGGSWLGPIVIVVAALGGFWLVRRLLSGVGGGSGGGNNMPGGGGGGGSGMMGNIFSGIAGAVAGNWLYDSFMRPSAHGQEFDRPRSEGGWSGSGSDSGSSGGNYSSDSYDTSGGGGGDFGGGDFGGGDGGGGDSGGGGDY
jgi:hypothetical protein